MATSRSRLPAADALAAANQAQSAQLRAALLAALATLWRGLGSWHGSDVDRFLRLARPVLLGAQQRMTALTAAYLTRQVALLTGMPHQPAGIPTPAAGDLRGLPLDEEYTRPFRTVWTELAAGTDLPAAVDRGQQRLENLAATDLQLAKTYASRELLRDNKRVIGYRRVLEGAQSCGLCIVASTQRYHKADLMPIHPGCDCSIAPIVGTADPGHVLDEQRLDDVHAAIADRFGKSTADARGGTRVPDYRKVLVVHQHGEIGPVLTVRGQRFTGPSNLPA